MPKITIRNLDTEINRRIKLIKTSTSVVDVGEQNGAVSDQSDSVHICLSLLEIPDIPIGCEGAVSYIEIGTITDGGIIDVYLNDEIVPVDSNFFFRVGGASEKLRQVGINSIALNEDGTPATDYGNGDYYDVYRARLINLTDDYQKIRIEALDANPVDINFTPENESFFYVDSDFESFATFCLAPTSNFISCDGALNSVLFFDAVSPETNPPTGTTYFKIDGVLLNDEDPFPDWLEIQFLNDQQPDQSQIPDGFVADGENGNLRKLVNNDGVSHRIEMGSFDPSLVREIMYGNSTVIERTEIKGEDSGVCLAPLDVCSPTYYVGDAALSENYDPKAFEYKINDLDFVELTIAESGTYLTSSIFNAINADTGISDLFVAGGTGYYAFTDNGANFTVEGGDGSDTFDPVTVVLRDSQTTIIADMFGSSEISLHSCGLATPIDT
ncbi:hypothetical protein [Acinetobacter haemolyticus]|uniref:hypothetical protein n=1 Tax=Acinetobacter haemolyticus TaxID=29430 RepID=UPI000D68F72D|nr:hypothetical protein [Acinetobacter haemolyticus]